MTQVDPNTRKRHWFLVVWSVPQAGFLAPVSAYVSSDKRRLTIPEINTAKGQRQLPEGAVVVNVAYVGHMTQYELTGTSPEPVPTVVTAAFNLGLEQALTVPDPLQLQNAFPETEEFNRAEWESGAARGRDMRTKIVAASARPPNASMMSLPEKDLEDVR
jgi:hypothetical protein